VHDVPATGTEPELDCGRVHHDVVALGDWTGEIAEHVGTLRPAAEVHVYALQPGALLE
jgi:hypothetical protein